MSENGYERRINELKRRGLWRQLSTVESVAGRTAIIQGREAVVFGSNNYLGLANHPHIIEAIKQGLDAWGFGAGASRLICGNTAAHERLQGRLAGLLCKSAALVFPSGYQTNIAVLSSLAGAGDLVVLDKLSHASLIDGARAGGATVRTFAHRQYGKLRRLLDRGGFQNAIVVTDSLFSMDGDLADLAELVDIKRRYDALLMVDEAHAFGCLGPEGAGWAAELGLLDAIDVVVVTFSKALGGVGGAVACSRTVADYLVNRARGFIYTTAVPAVYCLAAESALDLVAAEPERRKRLRRNAESLRGQLREMDFEIGSAQSHVMSVIVGSADKAVALSRRLFERGLFIPAIRPPTVKADSSRLRVSVTSEHTPEDLARLCHELRNGCRDE